MEIRIGILAHTQGGSTLSEKVTLSCRQVYRVQNHRRAIQIQGLKGTLYVTVPDDPKDHIIQPGDQILVRSRGLVLVQGLPEGTFRYII